MADVDPAEAAFDALLDELTSLEVSKLTWLEIAARLLTFCHKFRPLATAWSGLSIDPWHTVLGVELSAGDALVNVDRTFFVQRPGLASKLVASSSFASREHVRALVATAKSALSPRPFADTRFSLSVVARGLAGAIDNLAGSTYMTWFKNQGEVTIAEGEPYPVCSHDPRPWLGTHAANTNPASRPNRDLSFTPSLRIATGPLGFTYTLDFTFWDRLSPLGSSPNGLVMAAAQPNLGLAEFTMDTDNPPNDPATWYANHGPGNAVEQVDRITRLIEAAMRQGAELVLMPEYAASEITHTALETALSGKPAPIVFCIGISRPDKNKYVHNEAWLRVSTPGVSQSYSAHFHAKTSGAKLFGAAERIHTASEIRVFVSPNWSLSVLICVEVLATEIPDQLAKIGANLLLVPAMSEKTGSMARDAGGLREGSQAFVVMANGPAFWWPMQDPPCEAFFAGPYASSPSSWEAPLPGQARKLNKIAAWIFRASRKTVSIRQLPA